MILSRARNLLRSRASVVTLGVQGVVIDESGCVLLVRHGYREGWHFPGGGVEHNEAIEAALARELLEEAGVVLDGPPRLFGIYSHFDVFPGDHIVLFVTDRWSRLSVPAPNREIAEQDFFPPHRLPEGVTPGTRRRLA